MSKLACRQRGDNKTFEEEPGPSCPDLWPLDLNFSLQNAPFLGKKLFLEKKCLFLRQKCLFLAKKAKFVECFFNCCLVVGAKIDKIVNCRDLKLTKDSELWG